MGVLLPRLLWSTVHPRFAMQRFDKSNASSYDLSNCFGFSESEVDLSLWEKSSVINETTSAPEFQADKPYRLALYVRPSQRKRLHRTKTANPGRSKTGNQSQGKKNETANSSRVKGKRPAEANNKPNKKINIMLFDENFKPESVSKGLIKATEKEKAKQEKRVTIESPVRKTVLKEVNIKPLTKSKQTKTRRSYERKFKEKDETENIPEPSSEEIIKELEFKKLSRTKQKKMAKEEQEFEKWANSINSDFNDVDKFELSIAYD